MLAIAALSVLFFPQLPSVLQSTSPEQRFVDFSVDLDRPGVSVVLGKLTRMKEGKRKRMREGGKLGNAFSSQSVSGVVFYRVPLRGRLVVDEALAGEKVAGKAELGFEIQLAKMPDGTERRQTMTANGAKVVADTIALWVIQAVPKKKQRKLLHVIPFDSAVDKGKDPGESFANTMRDFVAINQAMAEIDAAVDDTTTRDGREPSKAAVARLRKAAELEVELRDPELTGLVASKVNTRKLQARKRLERLDADGRDR